MMTETECDFDESFAHAREEYNTSAMPLTLELR